MILDQISIEKLSPQKQLKSPIFVIFVATIMELSEFFGEVHNVLAAGSLAVTLLQNNSFFKQFSNCSILVVA